MGFSVLPVLMKKLLPYGTVYSLSKQKENWNSANYNLSCDFFQDFNILQYIQILYIPSTHFAFWKKKSTWFPLSKFKEGRGKFRKKTFQTAMLFTNFFMVNSQLQRASRASVARSGSGGMFCKKKETPSALRADGVSYPGWVHWWVPLVY